MSIDQINITFCLVIIYLDYDDHRIDICIVNGF